MALDEQARQFLESGPIKEIPGQTSRKAEGRVNEYRQREFLTRSAQLNDDLIAFFIQQKKKHGYLDEECVGGIALFCINLRKAYGSPQNAGEQEKWTPEMSKKRLEEFDTVCQEMQAYHDENA